jgi:hypothetical protein
MSAAGDAAVSFAICLLLGAGTLVAIARPRILRESWRALRQGRARVTAPDDSSRDP